MIDYFVDIFHEIASVGKFQIVFLIPWREHYTHVSQGVESLWFILKLDGGTL